MLEIRVMLTHQSVSEPYFSQDTDPLWTSAVTDMT